MQWPLLHSKILEAPKRKGITVAAKQDAVRQDELDAENGDGLTLMDKKEIAMHLQNIL